MKCTWTLKGITMVSKSITCSWFQVVRIYRDFNPFISKINRPRGLKRNSATFTIDRAYGRIHGVVRSLKQWTKWANIGERTTRARLSTAIMELRAGVTLAIDPRVNCNRCRRCVNESLSIWQTIRIQKNIMCTILQCKNGQ